MSLILIWHLVLLDILLRHSSNSVNIGNEPWVFLLSRHLLINQNASPSNTRPTTPPIAAPAMATLDILLFSVAAPWAVVAAVLPAAVSVLSDGPRPTMLEPLTGMPLTVTGSEPTTVEVEICTKTDALRTSVEYERVEPRATVERLGEGVSTVKKKDGHLYWSLTHTPLP